MSKSIKLCETMLQPQQQNGVSWLDLGLGQINVEGNGWVSSSQCGGSAILGGPWWVWDHGAQALLEHSQETGQPGSAKLLSQFGICAWAQAQVQLYGSKTANITEIQNVTKSYIFLPTLAYYSMKCFFCSKL